jgi:hypothetical protein
MMQPNQPEYNTNQTQPTGNYGQSSSFQTYQPPSNSYLNQYPNQGYQTQTPAYPPQNYYQGQQPAYPYQTGYLPQATNPGAYPASAPRRASKTKTVLLYIVGFILGIVIFAILGLVVSVVLPKQAYPNNSSARQTTPTPRSDAATPTPGGNSNNNDSIPTGFAQFTSKEGRYSVIMPANPFAYIQKFNTPLGSLNVNFFINKAPDTQPGYGAGYGDYPPGTTNGGDAQKSLHSVLAGQESSLKATSTGDEQAVNLNGVPGRTTSYSYSQDGINYVCLTRVYLDGDRFYQVVLVYPVDNKPPDSQIDVFFKSFTITK